MLKIMFVHFKNHTCFCTLLLQHTNFPGWKINFNTDLFILIASIYNKCSQFSVQKHSPTGTF